MKLHWTFLRSKVEKRLFGLFFSCAIVPIAVLSLLSFDHVTKHLYEQSRARLHQASKATGMTLLQRIADLETELENVIAAGMPTDPNVLPKHHFRAIEELSEGGERTVWLGRSIQPPEIDRSARAHLQTGKALLHVAHTSVGEPRVLLTKRIRRNGSGMRLTAEIDRDFIFDISGDNTLPATADFCILDESDRVIACSTDSSGLLNGMGTERPVSGRFVWKREGRNQLGYFWSLFLKPNYHAAQWTIVLSEPEDEVLAPIASFRTTFPFAVLLSVFVVTLMCMHQIRRRLVPLKQLRDGTRRIAERDFDVEISIQSRDEFQELAESFNVMTRKLAEQFAALATMIDIDRTILSAIDRDTIVNTLIARLRELYPCDAVAVSLVDPNAPNSLQTQFSREAGRGSKVIEVAGFTADEARQLGTNPESLLVDLDPQAPHYLEPHARAGMQQCLLLPLFVRHDLAGVVSLGHKQTGQHDLKRLVYARQLADQTAMALANAETIEENRALAYYDQLTQLPNRLLFRERLEQAVSAARRHGEPVAIFIFDIDALKRINDTLGHDVGDLLLKLVADRASHCLPAASLARTGGDEFGVLLTDLTAIDDPARIAKRILDAIAEPFRLPHQEAFLTASIGIAMYPDDGVHVDGLLRNADAAMHHAKAQGGNNLQFYARAMNASAFRRLELENELRRAIEREELRVYYQPIVDIETRHPIGAEALLRWQHAKLGVIPPSEFIPLAEETGLIVELGRWTLETACTQNRKWQNVGIPPITVAVNISSRQLRGENLEHTVRRALNSSGMRAQYLILEITESILMNGDEATLKTLDTLKAMGVQLSIDDFGTGYSSLSYLKNFPLDHLKIDRSFMKDVTRRENDAAITKAIIAMAHNLKLQVIAEGVELEAQMEFLRQNGCDAAQGYLISDPIAQDAFTKLLWSWVNELAARER